MNAGALTTTTLGAYMFFKTQRDIKADHSLLTELLALVTSVRPRLALDALPKVVLPKLVSLLHADIAAYYTLRSHGQLQLVAFLPDSFWASTKIKSRFFRRDTSSFAIGRAIREQQPILISDPLLAEKRREYEPFDPRVTAEIIIPIFAKGTVVGVAVLSRISGTITPLAMLLCQTVAVILGAFYDTALDSERQEQTLTFLKATAAIRSDDPDTVFTDFLEAVEGLIRARFVSLWLHNELDSTLVIRSFYPNHIERRTITFESLDHKVLSLNDSLSGTTVSERAPQVFFDIQTDARYSNRVFAKAHRLSWFISLPILMDDGRCYGVVNVYPEATEHRPDDETLQVMSLLVSQIGDALAVSSLRRIGEIQKVFDRVFYELLDSSDKRHTWDELSRAIASEMRCEACSIFLVRDDGALGLAGTTGLIGDPTYKNVTYQPGEGLTGAAFARLAPIVHYSGHGTHRGLHISKYREVLTSGGRSRAIIVIPLRSRDGQALGVIRCNNKDDTPSRHCGRFTRDDIAVLERLAMMLADVVVKTGWLRKKKREFDSYVHIVHHDLLTPIDGILTQGDWLKRHIVEPYQHHFSDPALAIRRTEDIIIAAQQMELLIKAIGDNPDDITIAYEKVALVPILQSCRGWIRSEANRAGVRIDIQHLGKAKVRGDKGLLVRVVYNVLQNAVKYADPDEAHRLISVRRIDAKQRVIIDFEDNGIGVLPEDDERIFLRYERGTNASRVCPKGMGLGLEFARRSLRAHGGDITLHSPGKPTVFRLDFGEHI